MARSTNLDLAPVGRVDAATVAGLAEKDAERPVVIDLTDAGDVSRDGLELLASLQERGRVRVEGARWPHVLNALLAAPLGEVGRLGVLARRVIGGRR
ncbi:hypothetical protein ACR9E3_09885 [Actinomycetospora sp. C-140]